MRHPKFLAESIHKSIRQKYRDTRVDTRYLGRGGREEEGSKNVKKSKFKFTKAFDFFYYEKTTMQTQCWLYYTTRSITSGLTSGPDIGRVLYPIRYSTCRVDTRYRPDSCIAIQKSSIAQPYLKLLF